MKTDQRPPFDFNASGGEPAAEEAPAPARPTFGNPPKAVRDPPGWPVYFAALLVTVLWAGAVIAYAVGYQRGVPPLNYEPFALGVLGALAVGPTALIWIAAYALRQGMRLSAEVRRARDTTAQMLAPAGLAAAEAGTVVEAVRAQIEDATAAARQAQETMNAVRDALERESQRLNEAAAASGRAANEAAGTLSEERGRLHDLSETLGAQAGAIRQAADHAAEVTSAAGQATDAARAAGEELARHVTQLQSAGTDVGAQLRATEDGLGQQHAALSELAERLKAEQEALTAEADARIAKLSDLVVQSRAAVAEVSETGQQGSEAIQHLTAAAAERFGELKAAADREREALAGSLQESIQQISATAEEARHAAETYAEAARQRVDQLNEAAFEAGRKADAAFEARLEQARGLIGQSAEMIETAGGKATDRLDQWTAAAKAALGDLENLLGEITERAEALPAEAERRAEALRASMEQNLGNLVASVKHASEETKALDEAFQQRVRANYQMLSEAVRLMGLVAGEPGAAPPAEGEAANLRGRLRLTPAEAEAEAPAAEPEPEPEPEPEDEGLGWKGLLESLDRDGADPEQLSERMVAEVREMGFDPTAILPSAKVDEIAAAVQTGDADGARQVVRNVAGTATDKLAKRLFADAALRGQADRYRRRFSGMLKDAAKRDQQGFMVGSLLSSDEGRTYLLLDAAAPDKG